MSRARAIAVFAVMRLEVIWPNVLVLVAFAVAAIGISAARYRSQLR